MNVERAQQWGDVLRALPAEELGRVFFRIGLRRHDEGLADEAAAWQELANVLLDRATRARAETQALEYDFDDGAEGELVDDVGAAIERAREELRDAAREAVGYPDGPAIW